MYVRREVRPSHYVRFRLYLAFPHMKRLVTKESKKQFDTDERKEKIHVEYVYSTWTKSEFLYLFGVRPLLEVEVIWIRTDASVFI